MRLSVIMPVHNEVETVDEIIEHVLNITEVYELIIVDQKMERLKQLKKYPLIKLKFLNTKQTGVKGRP